MNDDDDEDGAWEVSERLMATLMRCVTLLIAIGIICATTCNTVRLAIQDCPVAKADR